MKFTLSWLSDYLETTATLEEISTTLTAIGLEVEEITNPAEQLNGFVVAKILEAKPHPDADKLQICSVNNGKETLQIVCGAANARTGIKVVLAPVGVTIPNGDFKIRASKIRGIESNGMLCSETELNLGEGAQGIMELSTDSKIGDSFANTMNIDDPVIEIAITPNRGDCLGVYGIARDLAAAGLGTLKPYKIPTITHKGTSATTITIDDEQSCPFFIGCTITDVKNTASPDWLQQRLTAIGLNPISALVDITNYITHAFGRPLHVYDADKLTGNLVVRPAKQGEIIAALNDKTYTLDEGMTIIADNQQALAIGGVIGGETSGVTEHTANVFLEVAFFDPIAVASTGRSLQIDTDSRYRFERQVDPAFMQDATAITLNLIQELCGGHASEIVTAGQEPAWQKTIDFPLAKVKQLGGIDVKPDLIENILTSLGFKVNGKGGTRQIDIPSWRPDIDGQADLVEETLRIYGYDTLEPTPLPMVLTQKPVVSPTYKRLSQARRSLASRGAHEIITWSFISSNKAKHFGGGNTALQLMNPISTDLNEMRPSLLPNLLDAIAKNEDRGFKNLALFETGPTFSNTTPEGRANVIATIRSGQHTTRNTHSQSREVDCFDSKADAIATLEAMGAPVKNFTTRTENMPKWYHPGRSGQLCLGKTVLAQFGELHPLYKESMDISSPVVMSEIFVDQLPAAKAKKTTAKPTLTLSDYQAVERDFAFLVSEDTPAADIIRAITGADKKLIQSVSIFDIYQGKGVEEGKKSVALSITLQAMDRTLKEEEITAVSKEVVNSAEKKLGALLRG